MTYCRHSKIETDSYFSSLILQHHAAVAADPASASVQYRSSAANRQTAAVESLSCQQRQAYFHLHTSSCGLNPVVSFSARDTDYPTREIHSTTPL
jgi:hypothetical protein